jgi:subtilisin family serine protease
MSSLIHHWASHVAARISALVGASVLFTAGLASPAIAVPCELLSDVALDRMTFHLIPGATASQLLDAIQIDWPDVDWTVLDQKPQRGFYCVQVLAPASWTDIEWNVFHSAMDVGYPTVAYWLEFVSDDEAPEGGTGSTFVDGLADLTAYQNQYAKVTLGLSAAHLRSTGVGVVIAVLDTGVDAGHEVLAGRLLPGWDFVDGDAVAGDDAPGQDLDGDGQFDEMAGHGTYISGLIALVAPDARILPLRVLDSEGRGESWRLASGVWYAIDRGVEVINLSLGSTEDSKVVEEALLEASNLGITVVAAAGNCDRSMPREFPAMTEHEVIGVAAVDDLDVRAGFSNFHSTLNVSAPAVSVFDAKGQPLLDRSIVSSLPEGNYGVWDGTSMGAAFVSAAAALVRSQHPEWAPNEVTSLSVQAVLVSGALNIDALNPDFIGLLGAGRLDAAASTALGPVSPVLGDLDGNGAVNIDDLLLLLGDWGQVHSSADVDGNGTVNIDDLLVLLGGWG